MTSEKPGEAAHHGDTAPRLLKLSEVRRDTGIAVDSLRLLIQDQVLVRGVERTRNGHVYMRVDQVPSYSQLVAMLERQLRSHLERAREHMRRVEIEMEAVRNDLELALEDPKAPLGHDLMSFRAHSSDPRSSTLASAMSKLQEATWDIRRYRDALTAAEKVGPELID